MGNTNRVAEGTKYNTTQLGLCRDLGRLILHRDLNAHLHRFGYVLKHLNLNKPKVVMDVGCGDKQLAACIYSNKHSKGVKTYHGVDLRDKTVEFLEAGNHFPIEFHKQDVCDPLPNVHPDLIVNFEVIEHMPKDQGLKLLDNLKSAMSENTVLLLSTPCYDESKGQAANHVYEWKYEELKEELESRFIIAKHFGTFMDTGIGENKKLLDEIFGDKMKTLREFHHNQQLSNMFAPLFPEKSRNCIWELRLRNTR